MNRSTSFEIFKRNQVLFIEVGIIYVVLLCFMLFLPLGGATYAISSVILFWIFTSLIILMLNKEVRKEFDFFCLRVLGFYLESVILQPCKSITFSRQ